MLILKKHIQVNLLFEKQEKNYDNNEWGTFRMWNKMGYRIKANEKATYIFYNDKFTVEDENKFNYILSELQFYHREIDYLKLIEDKKLVPHNPLNASLKK